jgi:hypothetical protein
MMKSRMKNISESRILLELYNKYLPAVSSGIVRVYIRARGQGLAFGDWDLLKFNRTNFKSRQFLDEICT